jgi:putative membrane protein
MQQLIVVAMNIAYAAVGVLLMFLSIKLFDLITKVELEEELQKGNIAVGIFVGAMFISIALIIGRALS